MNIKFCFTQISMEISKLNMQTTTQCCQFWYFPMNDESDEGTEKGMHRMLQFLD